MESSVDHGQAKKAGEGGRRLTLGADLVGRCGHPNFSLRLWAPIPRIGRTSRP